MVDDESEETATHREDTDYALRFSLAGVQLKFSAVLENSGTLTIPVHGQGGSWIVKVPNLSLRHVPEAEYSMLSFARESGIMVPEIRLVRTDSINNLPLGINADHNDSLVVRRFDRNSNGMRIHMEDFAQIFQLYPGKKYGSNNYDQIAEVIYAEAGSASLIEYIKRLVFTVAIGNGDMHLKNWTLLYKDGRTPELSPAYDFIPTILYMDGDTLGLNLGGENSFRRINFEHFGKARSQSSRTRKTCIENCAGKWWRT